MNRSERFRAYLRGAATVLDLSGGQPRPSGMSYEWERDDYGWRTTTAMHGTPDFSLYRIGWRRWRLAMRWTTATVEFPSAAAAKRAAPDVEEAWLSSTRWFAR